MGITNSRNHFTCVKFQNIHVCFSLWFVWLSAMVCVLLKHRELHEVQLAEHRLRMDESRRRMDGSTAKSETSWIFNASKSWGTQTTNGDIKRGNVVCENTKEIKKAVKFYDKWNKIAFISCKKIVNSQLLKWSPWILSINFSLDRQ